jgi:hypothetical protein
MFLLQIYVTGTNKTYVGLNVKCPILLPDIKQIQSFTKISQMGATPKHVDRQT